MTLLDQMPDTQFERALDVAQALQDRLSKRDTIAVALVALGMVTVSVLTAAAQEHDVPFEQQLVVYLRLLHELEAKREV